MNISYRVTEAREALGLSKSKLAKEARVSPSFISGLEKGTYKSISATVLFRLADALRVSPRWLSEGIEVSE